MTICSRAATNGRLPASRELKIVVQTDKAHDAALAECDEVNSSLRGGWRLVQGRLVRLRDFRVGIATAYPNTSTVDRHSSILKLEKDDTRQSLTDSLLEGSMQCKQFK